MWCGVTGQPGGGVILPCCVCKGGAAKTPVYHNALAALQTQVSVDSLRSQASRHSRSRVAQSSDDPTAVCCLGTLPLLSLCCMQDVLGHHNARVFVSHCGLHSVYEAAFHGVPVVGVPFMFEQAESGAKLAATGAAVMCEQAPAYRRGSTPTYTRKHVAELIRQVGCRAVEVLGCAAARSWCQRRRVDRRLCSGLAGRPTQR